MFAVRTLAEQGREAIIAAWLLTPTFTPDLDSSALELYSVVFCVRTGVEYIEFQDKSRRYIRGVFWKT